ncbi:hypothetical protein AQJ91_46865 [Streptomyces dysideae]|uniref:Uncharacterized protein n=1 Tax=Streptomyces dysideae TaxID=909626 RepID=A0A101UPG4_9ACTN|nr:hypothetical protein AQJ91_46865 [Streptomyces dysideae]
MKFPDRAFDHVATGKDVVGEPQAVYPPGQFRNVACSDAPRRVTWLQSVVQWQEFVEGQQRAVGADEAVRPLRRLRGWPLIPVQDAAEIRDLVVERPCCSAHRSHCASIATSTPPDWKHPQRLLVRGEGLNDLGVSQPP